MTSSVTSPLTKLVDVFTSTSAVLQFTAALQVQSIGTTATAISATGVALWCVGMLIYSYLVINDVPSKGLVYGILYVIVLVCAVGVSVLSAFVASQLPGTSNS